MKSLNIIYVTYLLIMVEGRGKSVRFMLRKLLGRNKRNYGTGINFFPDKN